VGVGGGLGGWSCPAGEEVETDLRKKQRNELGKKKSSPREKEKRGERPDNRNRSKAGGEPKRVASRRCPKNPQPVANRKRRR